MHKQKGVALITVLMVMAIVALLATEMSGRLQFDIKRQINRHELNQAYWYAMSAEVLAKNILRQAAKDEPESTHLQQFWAQEGMTFPVEGGSISGKITDLQSCFNLNALQLVDNNANSQTNYYVASLIRLLNTLEVETPQGNIKLEDYQNQIFAHSLADWLDTNTIIRSSYGAEDSEYEAKAVPYVAANNLMVNYSEAIAVNGANRNIYKALKDGYGCVIPNKADLVINVNTVSSEKAGLIAALLPPLSVDDAASAISARPEDGFANINDFWNLPELKALNNIDKQKQHFDIKSQYFLLESEATYNESRFKLASVIRVDANQNAHVIAREIGGAS